MPKGGTKMKPSQKNRSVSYKRAKDWSKANRKAKITKRCGWSIKYLGELRKGKIHCGCKMCKPTKRFGYPTWYLYRNDIWMKEEIISEWG